MSQNESAKAKSAGATIVPTSAETPAVEETPKINATPASSTAEQVQLKQTAKPNADASVEKKDEPAPAKAKDPVADANSDDVKSDGTAPGEVATEKLGLTPIGNDDNVDIADGKDIKSTPPAEAAIAQPDSEDAPNESTEKKAEEVKKAASTVDAEVKSSPEDKGQANDGTNAVDNKTDPPLTEANVEAKPDDDKTESPAIEADEATPAGDKTESTESQSGSKRKDSPEKVTENQAVSNKKHKVNPEENKSMPLAEQVSNKAAKEQEV
jgi:hypothetical protein|eukprot:g7408.t1